MVGKGKKVEYENLKRCDEWWGMEKGGMVALKVGVRYETMVTFMQRKERKGRVGSTSELTRY